MRILADVHISPSTVSYLNQLGHDTIRSNEVLPAKASDRDIVARAIADGRVVLTQDLDFSGIIALSGANQPSLISLRLSDSRVENVNRVLEFALPLLESRIVDGIIATVEDERVRIRPLPIQ